MCTSCIRYLLLFTQQAEPDDGSLVGYPARQWKRSWWGSICGTTMNVYELTSLPGSGRSWFPERSENRCTLPGAAPELYGRRRHSDCFDGTCVKMTIGTPSSFRALPVQSSLRLINSQLSNISKYSNHL